jgi:UDP-N-acetylmuramate--alanine ligase
VSAFSFRYPDALEPDAAVSSDALVKVAIAGGGTAGHAYPGIALAKILAQAGDAVRFIGTARGIEARLAEREGLDFETIDIVGRERGLSRKNFVAAGKLLEATWRSLEILASFDPDVVVGTGGYVSLPVALAAWMHRIPVVVHEQNAVLGLANRVAARFARAIAISFPETQRLPRPAVLTGNPVRPEVALLDREAAREEAIAHFGLAPGRATLLITGGSQGAGSVNEAALGAYEIWRSDERVQVLHLAGANKLEDALARLEATRRPEDVLVWRALGYTDRMDLAYAVADLAVARAGATTVAELAVVGLPAILVPYPFALDDDQRKNAEAVVAAGGAEMILNADLNTQVLASAIERLLFYPARLETMSVAMKSLAIPDAGDRLANLVRQTAEAGPERWSSEGGRPERVSEGRSAPRGIRRSGPSLGGFARAWSLRTSASRLGGFDPNWKNVHLVGIGGAGMSAIARVLTQAGLQVSGSDMRDSPTLNQLKELGVTVRVGHSSGATEGADVVIASAAVPEENVELIEARSRNLPILARGEALALLVKGRRTIAVSGTHGKTTTSGMIATILEHSGADPTYLIGADFISRGPGARLGGGVLAVVEADEAYGSFLYLEPSIAVVTNIDVDHLDYFGRVESIEEAFTAFFRQASERTVVCIDDARATRLAPDSALSYGLSETAAVTAREVVSHPGVSRFELVIDGEKAAEVSLAVPGRHNVQNALGAAAAALAAGVEISAIASGLAEFRGLTRRFEYRGSVDGCDVIDDYAHHPAEVEAILETARGGRWSRIVAVFQPHLYSRTLAFWREFGSALVAADVVVVTDVYGAREEPVPGVTGKLVVEAACEAAPGKRVAYLPHLDQAAEFLRGQMRSGDLVITLGAGDITRLPEKLIAAGDRRSSLNASGGPIPRSPRGSTGDRSRGST